MLISNTLGVKAIGLATLFTVVFFACVFGQSSPYGHHKREADTTSYFIDLTKSRSNEVRYLQGEYANFVFHDSYAVKEVVVLEVFGSGNKKINQLEFRKKLGENQFRVSKSRLVGGWEEGRSYLLVIKDDLGNRYETVVKGMPSPETKPPVIDILYTAEALNCEIEEGNFIEFYGKIQGGKAPFDIEWTVSPISQGAFREQVIQDRVPVAGYTTAIQVSFQPSYLVTLWVIDGCGNEVQKSLMVSCEEAAKRKNNLMFQPIQRIPVREK